MNQKENLHQIVRNAMKNVDGVGAISGNTYNNIVTGAVLRLMEDDTLGVEEAIKEEMKSYL